MNENERVVDLKSFDDIAAAAEESLVRPLDALDGIVDLVRFFHTPPGFGVARAHVDYYAHRNMTIEGGHIPLSRSDDAEYQKTGNLLAGSWLDLFDRIVGTEGTVYVSPRMVQICADLAHALPEDPILRATDVPFEIGTVWLAHPMTIGELADENRVPIRVISWTANEPVTTTRPDETEVTGQGVTILSFTQAREVIEVNRHRETFNERSEETGRSAIEVVEEDHVDWIPWETMAWSYGEPWRSATSEEQTEWSKTDHAWTREDERAGKPEPDCLPQGVRNEETAVVRRFLFVLWRLMVEQVAVQVEYRPERQARRRVERSKRPSLGVRVIHLRRLYDPAVTLTEEEKLERKRLDRSWSHRWRVRDHWRRQPIGPRGSGLYRWVRIESYVKGPEDKPLIEKPTVWSLDR